MYPVPRTLSQFLIVLVLGEAQAVAAPEVPPSGAVPAAARSLQQQVDEKSRQLHALTQLEPQVMSLLEGAAAALRIRVEEGPPFQREERLARLDRLNRLLSDPVVEIAEKYSRVLEAYRIELDFSRTIEAYRANLADGETRLVDFLSLGRLALYYQTLDGKESGIWLNNHRRWQRLSGEDNEKITDGLRAARKLTPPDLIVLPLPGPRTQ